MIFEKFYKYTFPKWDNVHIILVGCGGTGSNVAISLARMIYDLQTKRNDLKIDFTLVDHDTVEVSNVGRQLFSPTEIGHYKSLALSQRINAWLGLKTSAVVLPVPDAFDCLRLNERNFDLSRNTGYIFLGCVDNATARKHISAQMARMGVFEDVWYIDAGNDYKSGQVLIGNSPNNRQYIIKASQLGLVSALPAPFVQQPALIDEKQTMPQALGCTLAAVTGDQSIMINYHVSSIVTKLLYNILYDGELHELGAWLNTQKGYQVTSIPITIQNLQEAIDSYNSHFPDSEQMELEVIDEESTTTTANNREAG